ncbi:UNVERIFIED_CONTAM: hypothetical protein RMT77_008983 [Armadillidium vulgare]
MNNTNKRFLENTDGFPDAKKAKFGSPNNSYRGRGNFSNRGSFRGRYQFNRGGGGFGRGGGGFNRGRGGFNRGRGRYFQNSNYNEGSRGVGYARGNPNCLKINFHDATESIKSALSEVLEKCDHVSAPQNLVTYWKPQNLIEKLSLLKEMKIDNEPLNFKVSVGSESKTKKSVFIPRYFISKRDVVKKFFNAASIASSRTNNVFVLTFPSSADASKAAKKVMVTDNVMISLKPHYDDDVLYSSTDNEESVKKLQDKLKTLAKAAKTKQVENNMEVNEESSEEEEEEQEDADDEEEEGEEEEDEGEEEEDEGEEEEDEDDDEGEEEEEEDDDDDDE